MRRALRARSLSLMSMILMLLTSLGTAPLARADTPWLSVRLASGGAANYPVTELQRVTFEGDTLIGSWRGPGAPCHGDDRPHRVSLVAGQLGSPRSPRRGGAPAGSPPLPEPAEPLLPRDVHRLRPAPGRSDRARDLRGRRPADPPAGEGEPCGRAAHRRLGRPGRRGDPRQRRSLFLPAHRRWRGRESAHGPAPLRQADPPGPSTTTKPTSKRSTKAKETP